MDIVTQEHDIIADIFLPEGLYFKEIAHMLAMLMDMCSSFTVGGPEVEGNQITVSLKLQTWI